MRTHPRVAAKNSAAAISWEPIPRPRTRSETTRATMRPQEPSRSKYGHTWTAMTPRMRPSASATKAALDGFSDQLWIRVAVAVGSSWG